jgi:signal transduction histidine kinase/DNA-binding response OmpR family regulator
LTLGVAATAAALLWMAFAEYTQYRSERTTRPQQVRIAQLAQILARVDELQNIVLVMALDTGDPQWEQRYLQLAKEEDAALGEVSQLESGSVGAEEAARLRTLNTGLGEVESRALELLRSGQRDAARSLLRGDQYIRQRQVYAKWLGQMATRLDAQVAATLRTALEVTRRNLLVAAGALLALLAGWFLLLRTFTRWESALADANRQLSRDIVEIKRVDRMKTEFVSTVSHELRTPLTSIRGSLGLLAGGVAGELPAAAANLVNIAKNNCERLIRLINDILDIEKIESGQMRVDSQVVDLGPMIDQAILGNASFAAQHDVTVILDASAEALRVDVDSDRLNQVITNLLSNAVKFSPAGGEVRVRTARVGDRARVEVSDRGPGIPDEFLDRIFQKFSQADSSDTRQKSGSGLGLSISKAIVERLGGRIGFTTASGHGTTFHFELPLRDLSPPSVQALRMPAGRPRILVCEDDRDVARLISMILDNAGFESDIAYDAAQARELLAVTTYSAMTVDLKLPDVDGVMLIRALRQDERTVNLPIVVVSATADEGRMTLNGEELSVSDWLGKPIDENRLVMNIRNAVAGAGSGRPHVLHVLHIEDDPDVQRIVATISQDFATFEFAATLREARARLQERRFDLILLDIMLPDGSGWELIDEVGQLVPSPPVVVFSAKDATVAERGRAAAVLVKSRTSNEQLLQTIKGLLERPAHAVAEGEPGR